MPDLGDVLMHGVAGRSAVWWSMNPVVVQPILDMLTQDHHEAASGSYMKLREWPGKRYADWIAELLLEGAHRFYGGYASDSFWTTRQLLQATSPHMSEERLRALKPLSWSSARSGRVRERAGWASFELVSALAKTVCRQMEAAAGELQRRFGIDQPPTPKDFVGGVIGSPIPEPAARHER